jgi:pseudouridine synthase
MARRRPPPSSRSPAPPKAPAQDWVGRALARAGVMPLDEAEAAIHAGRVKVAGRIAREPTTFIRQGDEVRVDGHRVSLQARSRVLMFHKPAGVVTAPTDRERVGTVFERLLPVLPPALQRYSWHAVGRLDRDTTGLLLFTNDERVVEHVTAPSNHLPRRYVAQVGSRADEAKLEPLRRGLQLPDGKARPASARVREDGQVELILTEGRFHQVKRMLGAVGLPVLRLHREALGKLVLDVPEGGFRELTEDEVRDALGYARAD